MVLAETEETDPEVNYGGGEGGKTQRSTRWLRQVRGRAVRDEGSFDGRGV